MTSNLFLYNTPILPDGFVILICFDGVDKSGDPKVYYHDYGHSGEVPIWDKRYHLDNFSAWLELAKEESVQYRADKAELD